MTMTTILSFVPHGWCGMCIVSETEHAHEILRCESWQVGELVARRGSSLTADDYLARRGLDKERQVSEADYQGARDRIREAILLHDVTAAVIEIPKNPKRAPYYTKLAEAVKLECESLGLETSFYLPTWRKECDIRGAVRDAILADWGPVSADRIEYDAQLTPAALLHQTLMYPEQYAAHRLEAGESPHLGEAQPAEKSRKKHERQIEQVEWRPKTDAAADSNAANGITVDEEPIIEPEPVTDWRDLPGVRNVPGALSTTDGALSTADEIAQIMRASPGQVCAGVDSGSHYIGLAVVQGDDAPVALRYLETIEIGVEVPLPKPKVRKYVGGTKTITHRRIFTDDNVIEIADRIVAKLLELGVSRLRIEHVDYAHFGESTVESASAIATALLRNMWLAVTLYERATAAGIECARVAHVSWQSKVIGRAKQGSASDRTVGEVLATQVLNWPGRTNVHERDAIGVAISGVLPERDRRMERKAKEEPKEPKVREPRPVFQRPICTCSTSVFKHRHAESCPMFAAKPKRQYLPKNKRIPLEEARDMLQRGKISAIQFTEYTARWWPEKEIVQ